MENITAASSGGPFKMEGILYIAYKISIVKQKTHPRLGEERLYSKGLLQLVFLNPSSCVQCTVRPNKPKRQQLEQKNVY